MPSSLLTQRQILARECGNGRKGQGEDWDTFVPEALWRDGELATDTEVRPGQGDCVLAQILPPPTAWVSAGAKAFRGTKDWMSVVDQVSGAARPSLKDSGKV